MVKTLIIYNYNNFFREQLYLFKGCKDIELGEIFLSKFLKELKIRYKGFYIVPIPSSEKSDRERGFNHVIEIFKKLDRPIIECLSKKEDFKQSKSNKSEREKALNLFEINKKEKLNGKKILIVDDVITTKTSLKAAISLVKGASPKKIEALILSKKF